MEKYEFVWFHSDNMHDATMKMGAYGRDGFRCVGFNFVHDHTPEGGFYNVVMERKIVLP